MVRPSTIMALAGAALLGGLYPGMLHAQSTVDFTGRSHLFVGYTASPPQQMAGFALAATSAGLGGWGLLVDGRFTTDSPAGDIFLSDRTPEQADSEGDRFHRERSAWTTLGLSAVKGLTPEFAVYLGGGVAWETVYFQYEDDTRELAPLGFYWVEDEVQSTVHPNVTLGAFLRMGNRLVAKVGGQSAPRAFVLGGYLRIL